LCSLHDQDDGVLSDWGSAAAMPRRIARAPASNAVRRHSFEAHRWPPESRLAIIRSHGDARSGRRGHGGPDLASKAAVLASRLIGTSVAGQERRIEYLCAIEFVARNGWTRRDRLPGSPWPLARWMSWRPPSVFEPLTSRSRPSRLDAGASPSQPTRPSSGSGRTGSGEDRLPETKRMDMCGGPQVAASTTR
jgi:hypothetical protein